MTKERLIGLVWLFILLGLVLGFFRPALTKTFIFRDAFNMTYPYKAVAAGYLKDFSVCKWNHYEVLGAHFVGELAPGWFYPGNFLFMVFPAEPAFRAFIVGHFVLAALFMWLWLSGLGLRPWSAAAGGLGYSLSGYALSQHGMPDMLAAAAWLPCSLWTLDKFLRRGSLSGLLWFGVSLSLPFLAGRAEAVLLTLAACGGWMIIHRPLSGEWLSRFKTMLAVFLAGGSVGLLLSMVQFLPSFELGRLSVKGGGFDLAVAQLWSLHPYRLLEFVLPFPWGRFWPEPDYLAAALTGWHGRYPWSLTHYLGLPLLVGAAACFLRAGWRERLLVGGCLVLVVLMSLGRYSYVYEAVYRAVPPFRIFRYPEKWMLLAALILASAGAAGLEGLVERMRKRADEKALLAAGAAAAVVLCGLLIVAFWRPSAGMNPIGSLMPAGPLKAQLLHALAAVLALSLALMIAGFRSAPRFLPGALLVFILALDLGLANRGAIPYASPEIYHEEPELFTLISEHAAASGHGLFDERGFPLPGRFRVMRDPLERPPVSALAELPGDSRLERHRRWELHTLMPNFNFLWGIEQLTGYTAAVTADYDRLMRLGPWLPEFELFNVRYLLLPTTRPAPAEDRIRPAGKAEGLGYLLYELPQSFPRAYLVGESLRLPDPMSELGLLRTHDFRRAVVVEDDPRLPPAERERELSLTPAEIVEYQPELVRINVHAPAGGYLVLSDSYYPGWRAEVDGRPAPIFRANFLVRAVWVEAGEREVVFRYQSRLYRAGMLISIAAVILCAAAALAIARREQKRAS